MFKLVNAINGASIAQGDNCLLVSEDAEGNPEYAVSNNTGVWRPIEPRILLGGEWLSIGEIEGILANLGSQQPTPDPDPAPVPTPDPDPDPTPDPVPAPVPTPDPVTSGKHFFVPVAGASLHVGSEFDTAPQGWMLSQGMLSPDGANSPIAVGKSGAEFHPVANATVVSNGFDLRSIATPNVIVRGALGQSLRHGAWGDHDHGDKTVYCDSTPDNQPHFRGINFGGRTKGITFTNATISNDGDIVVAFNNGCARIGFNGGAMLNPNQAAGVTLLGRNTFKVVCDSVRIQGGHQANIQLAYSNACEFYNNEIYDIHHDALRFHHWSPDNPLIFNGNWVHTWHAKAGAKHPDLVQIDITNGVTQELWMNWNVFDVNGAQGDTQGLFLEQFDDNGQGKLTGSVNGNVLRGQFLTGIMALKTINFNCSYNMIIPTRGGTPQGSGHETIKLGANAGCTASHNVAGELHHLADEPNSLSTKDWTQAQWEAAFPNINMDPNKISTKQEVLDMCRHVNGLYGPHA